MTYARFLVTFLLPPIVGLIFVLRRRLRRREWGWLAALMLIALAYTAAWDNYLVASDVWEYDLRLVTGITIGWVPIEEYAFFLLQPLLIGLWALCLGRRLPAARRDSDDRPIRARATSMLGVVWLAGVATLAVGWEPVTYLGLILAWALPPLGLQMAFGADILWDQRGAVVLTILIGTVYLSLADAIAIGEGTWTINPGNSLPLSLGGILPVEEAVFFLLTNSLVAFAVALLRSERSRKRLDQYLRPICRCFELMTE